MMFPIPSQQQSDQTAELVQEVGIIQGVPKEWGDEVTDKSLGKHGLRIRYRPSR
jgi:hypothetical protein